MNPPHVRVSGLFSNVDRRARGVEWESPESNSRALVALGLRCSWPEGASGTRRVYARISRLCVGPIPPSDRLPIPLVSRRDWSGHLRALS